jgi:hypothetical protein
MPSRSRVDAARHISQPRLDRYIVASNNDLDAALDLYEWNVLASGAFFESLGALEIALRNAMHEQLVVWCASDPGEWYDDPKSVFNVKTKQAIRLARDRVKSKGAQETPGRVVAEINFGFWRYLLTGSYQQPLWVPCLQHVFPGSKRQAIETPVASLHELRNRIAHHEAIFARDLSRDYDYLIEVAEHLHPRLAWWVDSRSRVPEVLSARP